MSIPKQPPQVNIPQFVNLSNPETLKDHIDPRYQKFIRPLLTIAQSVYESSPRVVKGSWGLSFPTNPELLSYCMKIMQKTQNGIAVEVGAAGGENSFLLAAANKTSKVIINDILPDEIKGCRSSIRDLPKDMQEQFTLDEGSGLDLLQRHPEIAEKTDFFLSRNVIHFLTEEQKTKLAQDVKTMLKPGGQAIISANGTYLLKRENPSDFATNSQCIIFKMYQILLRIQGSSTPDVIYRKTEPVTSNSYTSGFTREPIYKRDPDNNWKWKALPSGLSQLPENIKTVVKDLFKDPKIKERMKKENGCMEVQVLTSYSQAFNEETLPPIFQREGFNILGTCVTDYKGHVVANPDKLSEGHQVSVLIQKPTTPTRTQIPTSINFNTKAQPKVQPSKTPKTSC